jgi:hypothetical protein
MPKASPSNTELVDHGIVEVGTTELGGYSVDFLTVKEPVDMSRMLSGLPGDACQCPHWGVVNSGSMTVRYADGGEEYETKVNEHWSRLKGVVAEDVEIWEEVAATRQSYGYRRNVLNDRECKITAFHQSVQDMLDA